MSFAKQLLLTDILYSGWANQRLLEACSALLSEEVERDLHISHSNILATLRHIHDGERVWLDCLRKSKEKGLWRLPQGSPPELSLAELRRSWQELSDGYRRWLEDLKESGMGIEVSV